MSQERKKIAVKISMTDDPESRRGDTEKFFLFFLSFGHFSRAGAWSDLCAGCWVPSVEGPYG